MQVKVQRTVNPRGSEFLQSLIPLINDILLQYVYIIIFIKKIILFVI